MAVPTDDPVINGQLKRSAYWVPLRRQFIKDSPAIMLQDTKDIHSNKVFFPTEAMEKRCETENNRV
jgi:hypothetical protein